MVELAKTYESQPPNEPIVTKSYVSELGGEAFLGEKTGEVTKFDGATEAEIPVRDTEQMEDKNFEFDIIETPVALQQQQEVPEVVVQQQEATVVEDKKPESEIVETPTASTSFWDKMRNKLKKSISATKGEIAEVSDSITSRVQQSVPELQSL
ncbi:uncharacterized protein LOC111064431 [Nilaparvata lugens]|uniref:uncharacterized protein LOC111064431 n=1 Tax=Nilaparvata lugens TaxID=108931 RepID=UPI00193DEA38|nr:uncharacterized protein LOC111064431 [Nilaparvata lugens]